MGRVGQRVLGDLEIVRRIGEGAFASVYEVCRGGERAALKILHRAYAEDARATSRLMREAEVGARAGSPRIVQAFGVGLLEDGCPYVLMELVDGRSLRERLASDERAPLGEVVRLASEIAEGLAAAHAIGVVHRDLKPDNVLLRRDARGLEHPVIVDWGLTKLLPGHTDRFGALTRSGAVLGTVRYLSPEQAKGSRDVDARADQYALAVIVWEMLTGAAPYLGDGPVGALRAILHDPPARLGPVRPDLSPSFCAAVDRGLARDRGARFPDVTAFAAALRGGAGIDVHAATAGAIDARVPTSGAARAAGIDVHAATAGAIDARVPTSGAARGATMGAVDPRGATMGAVDARGPTMGAVGPRGPTVGVMDARGPTQGAVDGRGPTMGAVDGRAPLLDEPAAPGAFHAHDPRRGSFEGRGPSGGEVDPHGPTVAGRELRRSVDGPVVARPPLDALDARSPVEGRPAWDRRGAGHVGAPPWGSPPTHDPAPGPTRAGWVGITLVALGAVAAVLAVGVLLAAGWARRQREEPRPEASASFRSEVPTVVYRGEEDLPVPTRADMALLQRHVNAHDWARCSWLAGQFQQSLEIVEYRVICASAGQQRESVNQACHDLEQRYPRNRMVLCDQRER